MINKYLLFMLGSVVVAAISQILLKKAAKTHYNSYIREYLNVWVVSGYFLMIVSTLLTIMAYKGMDYKNGPIIEALGFSFVMVLSRIIYGEKITKKKIIGNILIFLGIIVFYS